MWFDNVLKIEQEKSYFTSLMEFVNSEYQTKTIYPRREDLYTTFYLCKEPKVVILGQDPYINENQAHGIAFSVYNEKITPSLRNIYKELYSDLQIERTDTNLSDWCEQGVLMFNTIFTVEAGKSMSHASKGWEIFSENIIKYLESNYEDIVYILWGANARKYKQFIRSKYVIESAHPSPLSSYRGFFDSKPFSRCNEYLLKIDKGAINW